MCRPYGWNGFPTAGDRKGRPYGYFAGKWNGFALRREPLIAPAVDDSDQKVTLIRSLRGHLPPWRGKAFRAADSRPYGVIRIRSVGPAKLGAVHKPQQRQILYTQAPSGAG